MTPCCYKIYNESGEKIIDTLTVEVSKDYRALIVLRDDNGDKVPRESVIINNIRATHLKRFHQEAFWPQNTFSLHKNKKVEKDYYLQFSSEDMNEKKINFPLSSLKSDFVGRVGCQQTNCQI